METYDMDEDPHGNDPLYLSRLVFLVWRIAATAPGPTTGDDLLLDGGVVKAHVETKPQTATA